MHSRLTDREEPWHRNPWVWLVIAIPAMTVAGCLLTLYLALAYPDYLVGDAEPSRPESAAPSIAR